MGPRGVKHTEYEEALVRYANLGSRYVCLPPPISFPSKFQLAIVTLLRRYQGEIPEEILKMIFSLFILILIIRTSKIWESCTYVLAQRPIALVLMIINSCSYSTNDLVPI